MIMNYRSFGIKPRALRGEGMGTFYELGLPE